MNTDQCLKETQWNGCCCVCALHFPLHSNPCVDGKPMSNKIGYICMCFDEQRKAEVAREHGYCEMFTKIN